MYMYRVHSAYHMYMQSQMQIHVKMSITFGGKLHYQASSKKKKKARELKSTRFKIWDGGRGKNVYLDGKLKILDIILHLYIKQLH